MTTTRGASAERRVGPAKRLAILGSRGIPAVHGGFETFAAHLAPYLAARGWDVEVACQDEHGGGPVSWRGVRLRQIRAPGTSAGSVLFDLLSVWAAARSDRLVLTLGYNTAAFSLLLRLFGRTNLINMDGLEWQRAKWPLPVKAWFWVNERIACRLGNHLIADHPEIARHLGDRVRPSKITMLAYGGDPPGPPDAAVLASLGLAPGGYALAVARIEPENSVLEMVEAFSRRPRGLPLVVLGALRPDVSDYHERVRAAASAEVRFLGAIYEPDLVGSLRSGARLHLHGHRVGGTNPSLVEALAAGNPVLAHDNRFNRWVAGEGARYFAGSDGCAAALDALLDDPATLCAMAESSRRRHAESFTWESVLAGYEALLEAWLPPR